MNNKMETASINTKKCVVCLSADVTCCTGHVLAQMYDDESGEYKEKVIIASWCDNHKDINYKYYQDRQGCYGLWTKEMGITDNPWNKNESKSMKIEDFNKVRKLMSILDKCEKAKSDIVQCREHERFDKPDCGGMPGFEYGYNMNVSECSDGSGFSVHLSGCYVGQETINAVEAVVDQQIVKVKKALKALGVE